MFITSIPDFDLTYTFEVVAVNGAGDGIKNYINTYGSEEAGNPTMFFLNKQLFSSLISCHAK